MHRGLRIWFVRRALIVRYCDADGPLQLPFFRSSCNERNLTLLGPSEIDGQLVITEAPPSISAWGLAQLHNMICHIRYTHGFPFNLHLRPVCDDLAGGHPLTPFSTCTLPSRTLYVRFSRSCSNFRTCEHVMRVDDPAAAWNPG